MRPIHTTGKPLTAKISCTQSVPHRHRDAYQSSNIVVRAHTNTQKQTNKLRELLQMLRHSKLPRSLSEALFQLMCNGFLGKSCQPNQKSKPSFRPVLAGDLRATSMPPSSSGTDASPSVSASQGLRKATLPLGHFLKLNRLSAKTGVSEKPKGISADPLPARGRRWGSVRLALERDCGSLLPSLSPSPCTLPAFFLSLFSCSSSFLFFPFPFCCRRTPLVGARCGHTSAAWKSAGSEAFLAGRSL